jgi:thymidylate synthase
MKDIPVLHVEGNCLAEAYERALVSLYENGVRIATQYDKEGDPESIDATMNITVTAPWSDPMIHKAFPGGIDELREYVFELLGHKDHWVKNMDDEADTRWEYTYHQRLADWGTWMESADRQSGDPRTGDPRIGDKRTNDPRTGAPGTGIDQIEKVVGKLAAQPHSRQAQMITWMPFLDFEVYDPPCLQSIWYRLVENDQAWVLASNVRFRSNDAWGANFMNMFGLTHFTRLLIADPLQEKLGKPVVLGRLNWQADSFHLYGKDQAEFKSRFWDRLGTTTFDDRVYRFFDGPIQEMWEEAEEKAIEKIRRYDAR